MQLLLGTQLSILDLIRLVLCLAFLAHRRDESSSPPLSSIIKFLSRAFRLIFKNFNSFSHFKTQHSVTGGVKFLATSVGRN